MLIPGCTLRIPFNFCFGKYRQLRVNTLSAYISCGNTHHFEKAFAASSMSCRVSCPVKGPEKVTLTGTRPDSSYETRNALPWYVQKLSIRGRFLRPSFPAVRMQRAPPPCAVLVLGIPLSVPMPRRYGDSTSLRERHPFRTPSVMARGSRIPGSLHFEACFCAQRPHRHRSPWMVH
jgi:hypothetical protein